ncbi:MAG: glycosyltransferase [Anaerolineae bacterium]|nr:glycosyltransferase [Anaerolineae bacterium]
MRVCYFGTYRTEYSRNQIMIEGLRRAGVEVIMCQVPLWTGIEDRVQAALGGWKQPGFLKRAVGSYRTLLKAFKQVPGFDVLMLGYPGQIDVFVARLLANRRRTPLVLDVFMSIYLIAVERGLVDRNPTTGKLIWLLEKRACSLPDHLIIDTAEYTDWFHDTYNLDPARFGLVPTGADDRIYRPAPSGTADDDGQFRVLYYGTYIPLHGVCTIVEAAALLRDRPHIEFEMVGTGPEKARAEELVQELGLRNVHFTGWVDKHDLPALAARANVCLGVFGTSEQSTRTIQNKIYEGMAMRKPVITGDSPTASKALEHGRHAYLVPRGDAQALAGAVADLERDPALCTRMAEEGYVHFQTHFTPDILGQRTRAILEEVVARHRRQHEGTPA